MFLIHAVHLHLHPTFVLLYITVPISFFSDLVLKTKNCFKNETPYCVSLFSTLGPSERKATGKNFKIFQWESFRFHNDNKFFIEGKGRREYFLIATNILRVRKEIHTI